MLTNQVFVFFCTLQSPWSNFLLFLTIFLWIVLLVLSRQFCKKRNYVPWCFLPNEKETWLSMEGTPGPAWGTFIRSEEINPYLISLKMKIICPCILDRFLIFFKFKSTCIIQVYFQKYRFLLKGTHYFVKNSRYHWVI